MGDAEIKELRETLEETTLCRNNESLELGDAEAALAGEQAKVRSLEAKCTEAEQRMIDSAEEARGLKATVNELKGENTGLERLRTELARVMDERDAEVDDLRAELDETVANNEALAVEVEASREKASRAMDSLEEVSEQLTRMYDGPAGASVLDQVVEVKGNLERLRVQCNEEKSSNGDKDDELEKLKQLTQGHGVKIMVSSARRSQQKGIAQALNAWRQFTHSHAVGEYPPPSALHPPYGTLLNPCTHTPAFYPRIQLRKHQPDPFLSLMRPQATQWRRRGSSRVHSQGWPRSTPRTARRRMRSGRRRMRL